MFLKRAKPGGNGSWTLLLVTQARATAYMAKKARRTTHRSVSGTKLYAVRDSKGRFKDIQTYKRAHSQDMKRKSKKEK